MREHVRRKFAEFGPRSTDREYFGFIYRADGKVASAVVGGRPCGERCVVDVSSAARAIPKHARLLGEWHTHPRTGSRALSSHDVRGAHHHRHIRCYQAFYSTPRGDIYAWDVGQTSVPSAMASRVHLGNLAAPLLPDTRWRLARSTTGRDHAITTGAAS